MFLHIIFSESPEDEIEESDEEDSLSSLEVDNNPEDFGAHIDLESLTGK